MNRIVKFKILCFAGLLIWSGYARASDRLDQDLLKSVLRIETSPNPNGDYEIGTGFLFTTDTDTSKARIFLVTNKHMVGDWNYADADVVAFRPWINVFFYRTGDPTGQPYRATKIDLLHGTALDESRVHMHPSPRIDLVAIEVTDKVHDHNEHIDFTAYAKSYLLRFADIHNWQTDIADQVIALGYPLGIRSLNNDYPIAKVGYLASVPGQDVSIPFPVRKRSGETVMINFNGKFLIVDGLIVNGNSGGPVVLVGGVRIRRDPQSNQLQFTDKPIPNYVIGVVSGLLGPSGLSVVIGSDYLLDLLDSIAPSSN